MPFIRAKEMRARRRQEATACSQWRETVRWRGVVLALDMKTEFTRKGIPA